MLALPNRHCIMITVGQLGQQDSSQRRDSFLKGGFLFGTG
jgi:hypothetical protein